MNASSDRILRVRRTLNPPLIALLLAVVLFFAGGLVKPNFVNLDQATNIVRLAAFLGIIAAGQTLVIISGGEGIDLSVGAVVTLGAMLTFRFTDGDNNLIPLGLLLACGSGLLIGLLNGLGVSLLRIPPLVMTLGMTGVVQGTVLVVTQGEMLGATPRLMAKWIASPLVLGIPGVIFIWLALGVAMWLVLNRTTYGKYLFAIGTNRTAARLSGVRVQFIVVATYMLSGLLAGFGGFILLGFSQTVFLQLGNSYLFPSIAAVVVGGTLLSGGMGSYWGTMSGALVLTLIDSLLRAMELDEAYQLIIVGIILLALISIYGRQTSLRQ
ncbi:MAG TPA: ABC transporter permease [Aggregatilinea sp.]|jgi:ribose transport system permease protein|uniref:ABC transporter permease n=1 Tax=Aggregatilinea sp. TaxID=2806333 RepID=UPI002BC898E5|nr:ABC transporter permease [Aggregatilinea sp.]HML21345.1 ABC transporter permease [Aggregatilinea sp.]